MGGQLVPVRAMNIYGGGGGVHPLILNLGAIWKWVVNFIPPKCLLPEKESLYPLYWRLGGPHYRSGCFGGDM